MVSRLLSKCASLAVSGRLQVGAIMLSTIVFIDTLAALRL